MKYQAFLSSKDKMKKKKKKIELSFAAFLVDSLRLNPSLKEPNKNCSRRHFNFLLLSFEDSVIFSEKQ